MKYLIFFQLYLFSVTAFAQDCDRESLKTLPGKWRAQPPDEVHANTPAPSAADAAGAQKILNRIRQLFQEQYKPVGAEAAHHYTHNISPGGSYANEYIYTIRNFLFYCSNGKKATNSEGLSSQIYVNPVLTGRTEFSEMPVYNENGEVNPTVFEQGGFHSFSSRECKGGKLPDLSSGYHSYDNGNDHYLWITYEGKHPYRYVSRKEFLEKQVVICEAKLKELNKFYSSRGWKDQFEAFPEHREKMLEGRKNNLSIYENPLKAYRQDLKKEEAWLHETAVVSSGAITDPATNKYLYSRYIFTTLNDPAMAVPIMPNPGYYNRNLPKWAPQFMVIAVGRTDGFIGVNVWKVAEDNIAFFKDLLAR
ncbi:MAG: hypothetical protein LRY55_09725 [Leadbetterella sp.]|nr:hypothetical protein [Leadbetterella sp.]